MRARLLIPVLALAALVAPTPALSAGDPFRPSVSDQIKLGKRASKQVAEEYTILPSYDARVKELRRIGNQLVNLIPEKERKEKPFEYTFDVIDSKEVNAFALPGGPIYFFTGLLDQFTTEDQVAAVLGHEITHIRNQHWASAYGDNQKRRLGITALLLILRAGDTAFDVAGVADTLLFTLPYARKHETESDNVGYDLMVKAGYNPQGMVDILNILAKGGGNKDTEFLSTHPDPSGRAKRIQERITASSQTFPKQTPRKNMGTWKALIRERGAVPTSR